MSERHYRLLLALQPVVVEAEVVGAGKQAQLARDQEVQGRRTRVM
jgi:hypothetical protein